jgi:hypothetical protein
MARNSKTGNRKWRQKSKARVDTAKARNLMKRRIGNRNGSRESFCNELIRRMSHAEVNYRKELVLLLCDGIEIRRSASCRPVTLFSGTILRSESFLL